MWARFFSNCSLFEKWSFDCSLKINCLQHYVRWIRTCSWLANNHFRSFSVSEVLEHSPSKLVPMSGFMTLFESIAEFPKNLVSQARVRFRVEIMIESRWLWPYPPLTLLEMFKSGPQGLKWTRKWYFSRIYLHKFWGYHSVFFCLALGPISSFIINPILVNHVMCQLFVILIVGQITSLIRIDPVR